MQLHHFLLIPLLGLAPIIWGQSNELIENMSLEDLVNVVDSYQIKNWYKESLPYAIQMRRLGKERYKKKKSRYLTLLEKTAQASSAALDWNLTQKLRMESVELTEDLYSQKSITYAAQLLELATVEMKLGNYQKSETLCWEVKNIKLQNPLNQRYYALQFFNQSIDRIKEKEKRRAVYRRYVDVKIIFVANLMTLSTNYKKMGDMEAYELTNQSALKETAGMIRYVLNNANQVVSDEVINDMKQLFHIFEDFENYQKGEKLYLKTMAWTRGSDLYKPLALNLARIYIRIGEYTGAKMIYTKLLHLAEQKHGAESLPFAFAVADLAAFYVLIEDSSEAAKLYLKAKGIVLRLEGRKSKIYVNLNKKLKNVYRVSQQRND